MRPVLHCNKLYCIPSIEGYELRLENDSRCITVRTTSYELIAGVFFEEELLLPLDRLVAFRILTII